MRPNLNHNCPNLYVFRSIGKCDVFFFYSIILKFFYTMVNKRLWVVVIYCPNCTCVLYFFQLDRNLIFLYNNQSLDGFGRIFYTKYLLEKKRARKLLVFL